MSQDVRTKLGPIPQGREGPPPHTVVPKLEDDEEERRHRPKPLEINNNRGGVTLPSFHEAYGSALAQFPAPQPPPQPQPQHHLDPAGRPLPPRPYPDSPNGSRPGPPPPGPSNGGDGYIRMQPEPAYRDSKDYYGYPPYGHYAERAPPPPPYWGSHQMPPNYQPAPPESAPRQRTSIACKYCRKRKIRCSGYQNTPDGKCTNCKKTGNDCVFQPVSSTTSTAFVPVSAIQGGVPPGTPLYGAFGQPLGPNGGRGPAPGAPNGPPNGAPNGHGMNGAGGPPAPPHPGYGPASPGPPGGYYQQQAPPPQHMPPHHQMEQNGPPQPPPPAQSQAPPPPSSMGPRSLPPPFGSQQQGPPSAHQIYPESEPRPSKRPFEDEDHDHHGRRPPPPGYSSASYYAAFEDGSRIHTESVHRSPPQMNGSISAPGSAVSPTSNGHRGYSAPAPPVLPPPPTMSSVGTEYKQYQRQ